MVGTFRCGAEQVYVESAILRLQVDSDMTRIILISTLMLGPASISLGESRQWTDQSGNTMRAEFTGVIDGRVVLKVGSKRQPFALTDFSLDDRDYIREQLVKRRRPQKR